MPKRLKNPYNWVFAILVGFILYPIAANVFKDTRVPIRDVSLEVLNSLVIEGEEFLILRVHRTKDRECELTSVRRAQDSDGVWHELPTRVWEGGSVTEDRVDLSIDVRTLAAGDYLGQNTATYFCPEGTYTVTTELYRFRVVEREK